MQPQFKIVCRGSKLSRAQADIFRKKLLVSVPGVGVDIVIKETQGDANQDIPLQEMEGKDFFTKDIHDYLLGGQADFAVHSLKDVSGENFFEGNHFAIIEREDPRDVALFHGDIVHRLSTGKPIIVGTSSPRRAEMATAFLRDALPFAADGAHTVAAEPIRGNVDTRLQKLHSGEFDGIILACAGLNRLLRVDDGTVAGWLAGKRKMILPLLTCPPAPGQGAIVVESTPGNARAIAVLKSLNDQALTKAVDLERKLAHIYGSGCHQKFGVVYVNDKSQPFVYAAGKDRGDKEFATYYSLDGKPFVYGKDPLMIDAGDALFRKNNIHMVTRQQSTYLSPGLDRRTIWVNETDTWFTLAGQGLWVEGSAEGLGLEFVRETVGSPLLNI